MYKAKVNITFEVDPEIANDLAFLFTLLQDQEGAWMFDGIDNMLDYWLETLLDVPMEQGKRNGIAKVLYKHALKIWPGVARKANNEYVSDIKDKLEIWLSDCGVQDPRIFNALARCLPGNSQTSWGAQYKRPPGFDDWSLPQYLYAVADEKVRVRNIGKTYIAIIKEALIRCPLNEEQQGEPQ